MVGHDVGYLTGPPASGKSSLSRAVEHTVKVFSYGEHLLEYLGDRIEGGYEELRDRSARVVTSADIDEVDHQLDRFVQLHRVDGPVLIDSHPVTKEDYGFRVTPFTSQRLNRIGITKIFCLYVDPETTLDRIGAHPGGRQPVTKREVGYHVHLQFSLAISYSVTVGCPLYLLDSGRPIEQLSEFVLHHLQ